MAVMARWFAKALCSALEVGATLEPVGAFQSFWWARWVRSARQKGWRERPAAAAKK